MKNKKIPLLALGMLVIGAIGSIAYQTHAAQVPQQTAPTAIVNTSVSDQADETADQKDANGKDLETNDDNKSILGTEKESAHDSDSDVASEQNEKDFGHEE